MRRILLTVALLGIAVSAGAQAPRVKPNPLGIHGYSGANEETKGNVIHLTGGAVIWFSNAIRLHATEATINFDTNRIELKGAATMTANVR
jgi:hypothetical protein